jgi:hypothetical protein
MVGEQQVYERSLKRLINCLGMLWRGWGRQFWGWRMWRVEAIAGVVRLARSFSTLARWVFSRNRSQASGALKSNLYFCTSGLT